eukprot:gi/632975760/ref/XP_007904409.1/ PREDICTED: peroxisome proliferator-activated receptor gamma coactivator 1-alpha-like isoform X2 [Callorhinchus milii]
MAECGLTDEDLSLFVFNYLAEGAEPQSGCGASAEDRLYSDFPEIDLSQLDVNDLDTGSCLGELQWDSEQSDISSSHYSTDGSELFQIIEEENEALLAALTATLGDIAVDDVSLSAFGVEAEQLGAVSSPAPPVSQPDEASLLRKLLLAPQSAQLTYERQKGSRVSRHGAGNRKPQSRRPFLKEEEGGGKANSTCQHRPFTELHKYLTSATCPPQLKAAGSHLSNTDPSNPGWTTQHHQSHHQQGEAQHHGDDCLSSDDANEESNCFSDRIGNGNGGGNGKQGQGVPPCFAPIQSEDVGVSAESHWTESCQFSTGAELHSVVELISYMHTYCLPVRKWPTTPPWCSGKRDKSDCSVLPNPGGERASRSNASVLNAVPCQAISSPAPERNVRKFPQMSMLRELLENNIALDVSKPYRLHNPLYPALVYTDSPANRQPEPGQAVLEKARRGSGKRKTEAGDAVKKPEAACLAVRRSLRLNPQLSDVLSCSVEGASARSLARGDSGKATKEARPLRVEGRLEQEEQVAEVEVDCSGRRLCDSGTHMVSDDRLPSPNPMQWPEEDGNEESSSPPDLPANTLIPCFHIVEDPRACTAQDLPLNANKMQEAKTSRKLAKPTSLLLSPESESDSKDSPLENKAFEQTLSVELCGTAGLTPPTTPPHKTARDDPFKSALKIAPGGGHEVNRSLSPKRLVKKQLEDTELYAYLSKAAVVPAQGDGRKGKRAYSRCFGDHDYCQLYSSEPEPDRKVLRLWELPRHSGQHSLKAKCDPYGEKRQKLSPAHGHGPNTEQLEQNKTLLGQSSNKKTMKDQEIRAKLYQHFGYPEQALPEEEKQHMLEDNERDSDSHYRCSDQRQGERVKKPGANPESQPPPPSGSSHPDPQPQLRTTLPADGILSGRSAPSPQRSHSSGSPQSRSPERPESVRDDDGDRYLLEGQNLEEGEFFEKTNQRDKRNLAIDEHRIVYVGKLTCGMTRSEVMRRFEAFGEIEECKVLACEKGLQCGGFGTRSR